MQVDVAVAIHKNLMKLGIKRTVL